MVPALHAVGWLWAGGLSPARMVVSQQVQGLDVQGRALVEMMHVAISLAEMGACCPSAQSLPRLSSCSPRVLGATGV